MAGVSARRMGGARVGRLGPSCPRPGSLPVSEEERKRRGLEERRPFVARGLDAVNPPVARDPAVLRENSFRVWKSALSTNAERPGPGCRNAVLYEIALVFLNHS